jgi:hypothetical protein
MKATKRHMLWAVVFVLSFFGPMFLIPVLPEVHFIQLLRTSTLAFLALFAIAVAVAAVVDWLVFRRCKKGPPQSMV